MTKSHARTGEDAKKHLELSLKALKTEQVDLWQIHTIYTPEDVDQRIKDGVLDVFLEAKEKGRPATLVLQVTEVRLPCCIF